MDSSDIRKPYRSLDIWRGVAALAITIHHATNTFLRGTPGFNDSLAGRFCWALNLGVEMFFVISGYCIVAAACSTLLKPNADWKTFAMARLHRIFPPYLFSLLAWALVTVAHALVQKQHLGQILKDPQAFGHGLGDYFGSFTLTSLLLGQNLLYGIAWTLCYEMAFYAIVGICLWFNRKARSLETLLRAIYVITAASVIFLIVAPAHRFYPFDMWPFFGLGALVFGLVKMPEQREPKIWAGATAVLLLICIGFRSTLLSIEKHSSQQALLFGLVFACLLLFLYKREPFLLKIPGMNGLAKVGLFSYSLYLTNMLSLWLVSSVWFHIGQRANRLFAIVESVFAVFAAWLFFYFCERHFLSRSQRNKAQATDTPAGNDTAGSRMSEPGEAVPSDAPA